MKSTSITIQDIAASINWQGEREYITKRDKSKTIITGIPTRHFWTLWKIDPAAIKAQGLTLQMERVRTGEFITVAGVKREKIVKSWECILWVSTRNAGLRMEIEKVATFNPF